MGCCCQREHIYDDEISQLNQRESGKLSDADIAIRMEAQAAYFGRLKDPKQLPRIWLRQRLRFRRRVASSEAELSGRLGGVRVEACALVVLAPTASLVDAPEADKDTGGQQPAGQPQSEGEVGKPPAVAAPAGNTSAMDPPGAANKTYAIFSIDCVPDLKDTAGEGVAASRSIPFNVGERAEALVTSTVALRRAVDPQWHVALNPTAVDFNAPAAAASLPETYLRGNEDFGSIVTVTDSAGRSGRDVYMEFLSPWFLPESSRVRGPGLIHAFVLFVERSAPKVDTRIPRLGYTKIRQFQGDADNATPSATREGTRNLAVRGDGKSEAGESMNVDDTHTMKPSPPRLDGEGAAIPLVLSHQVPRGLGEIVLTKSVANA